MGPGYVRVSERRSAAGSLERSSVLPGVGLVALVELLDQVAQLGAQEVAGGDLAQRDPQRGDLAGQELGVGVRPLVRLAVLLV